MVIHNYKYFIEMTNTQMNCKVLYCGEQSNSCIIVVHFISRMLP